MYIEVGRALLAVRCWWRARVLSTRFRRWSVTSAVSWVCGSVRPSSLPQRSSSLSGTSSTSSSTCALVDAVGERPTREKLPSVEPTTTSDTDWPLSDSFFYARQQNASRVFAIVWASVCLSVTLVNCIKTMQARITKSSLWAAPRSLVYHDKISCHWVQGPFCRCWLE